MTRLSNSESFMSHQPLKNSGIIFDHRGVSAGDIGKESRGLDVLPEEVDVSNTISKQTSLSNNNNRNERQTGARSVDRPPASKKQKLKSNNNPNKEKKWLHFID